MLQFHWYAFSDLDTQQVYEILKVRAEVFTIEQECLYLDPDGRDDSALHLLGVEDDVIAAYLRLFPPSELTNYVNFGRVLTSQRYRSCGYGKLLMHELLKYTNIHYPGVQVECSAQQYLTKFYQSFGFETVGEIYKEAGIPHIKMIKEPI